MPEMNDIIKELESMGSPLAKASRKMPYEVPAGYFEHLASNITGAVLEKDVVAELPKTLPFEAPKGYFEQLPGQLLKAVKEEERKSKTRTIFLGQKLWKPLRLAAAAVILMTIGFGALQLVNQQNSFEHKFANLSDDAVKEYVQQNTAGFETEAIENTVAHLPKSVAPSQLTEEEITAYLDETGWQ
jgi:hypothetical protein